MRHKIFGVLVATLGAAPPAAAALGAQEVPGRDLLLFPLGTLAEPQALATAAGLGLWNPAASALDDSSRARGTVAALTSPADQGVSMQLVEVAARVPASVTVSLSVLRGAVGGLIRTEDSPIGAGEIPYGTWLFSAGISRRQERVTVGLAARHRVGRLDGQRHGALGMDAGVLAERLFGVDARLAVASFLWRPASAAEARTTYALAGDARVWGADAHHQLRAGYSYAHTQSLAREHYVFTSARWSGAEGRAGIVAHEGFGTGTRRLRLGIGLHRARYLVGLAREEGGAGLDPIYQFTLSTTLP
jgi:hypothetical protein